MVIGAALLAIGLIAGWALSHLDAVTLFFSGSRTFDEEIETLHASSAVRWLVLGAVLAFVVSSVVLLVTFDSYQSQANERKSDARELRIKREQLERERQQAERDEQAQALRDKLSRQWRELRDLSLRLETGKREAKNRELYQSFERRLTQVERRETSSGDLLVSGLRRTQSDDVSDEVIEYTLRDRDTGLEKSLMVVHLFKEKGYWKFKRANSIVDAADSPGYNFWDLLEDESLQSELSTFNLVAGIGLQSKTPNIDDKLSRNRAAFLCAGISGALRDETQVDVLGLDIGAYEGELSETEGDKKTFLRPVVIVAIKVSDPEAGYLAFHEELLREVRVGGLDFGFFSKMKDKNPEWIEQEECNKNYRFVSTHHNAGEHE